MVDPVGLVKGVLGTLQTIDGAVNAVPELKTTLRRRYGDYASIIEPLESKPEVVIAKGIERELGRLKELFTMVANLIGEYTAAPGDGKWKKFNAMTKRAADYKDVNEKLNEIEGEVMRQLSIMCLKEAISGSEMETLKGIDAKVDRATSLLERLQPPRLPSMAAVPVGSLTLPDSYVERPCLKEVVDGLIKPDHVIGPYIVLGMGGTGKTLMASAVVNDSSVRGRFRGGIFWMRVGRGGNKRLLPLLQGLAREVGVAATDAPHGVPHQFDSLEQVKQHLAVVATTGTMPRLVVLDDVWEREVVDALRPMGFQLLVTTRNRSVVGAPGGCTVVGDMTDDEALELLLNTSRTTGPPEDDVRTSMMKVVAVCGRLPLVLAIAGSMPVVEGKGMTADAWENLHKLFQNKATRGWTEGEEGTCLATVLSASFGALSAQRKAELLKMAVMAAGAVAPIAMLLNLWETQDVQGTRDEAEGLVSRCLLQVADSGYRVHDLLLEFMQDEIKRHGNENMLKKATERQTQYLGRLDVVAGYIDPMRGPGQQGLFVLDALWRSLEELSGNSQLEVSSYRTSLEKMKGREASAGMANSFWQVGLLFDMQGKYADAELVCVGCTEIWERVFGPEHPDIAKGLNFRAVLLSKQGKYEEADALYRRALAIDEMVYGPDHPEVAADLNNWAGLLRRQGLYAEAEPLYERSQEIREKVLGPDHPDVAQSLNNRAGFLSEQAKYDEAQHLFERALAIRESALGTDHPDTITSRGCMADLYRKQGLLDKASPLLQDVLSANERVHGPDHPNVASALNDRAEVLSKQGRYAEADPLYQRALAINEKAFGPDHPNVATNLNNRAVLLEMQGRYAEAEPLYERSLEIREKVLGPDHPDVAQSLNNRAGLLIARGKHDEAIPLLERALAIRMKKLGEDHPRTVSTQTRLKAVQNKQVAPKG